MYASNDQCGRTALCTKAVTDEFVYAQTAVQNCTRLLPCLHPKPWVRNHKLLMDLRLIYFSNRYTLKHPLRRFLIIQPHSIIINLIHGWGASVIVKTLAAWQPLRICLIIEVRLSSQLLSSMACQLIFEVPPRRCLVSEAAHNVKFFDILCFHFYLN